jgi:hypothetical protein
MGEGEQFVEILSVFLVFGQIFDELDALAGNVLHILEIWSAQVFTDELDLVLGISAWQKRLSLKHFSEDAADTPHVD